MRIPSTSVARQVANLPYISNILFRAVLLIFLFGSALDLSAEGSKDLMKYDGYRMFLDTRDTQQMKVYANAGEFINIGSSHIGIQGGFITVYRPDGVMVATFNGNSGTNEGIIYNRTQEENGPTGGGTTNGQGYVPRVIEVLPGQEGVWTVYFGYPTYSPADFTNIKNSDYWTRALNQPNTPRVVLAWDITVTLDRAGNDNGIPTIGRVFTNELVSIINHNGYSTSPTLYVLTKNGFIYQVDFIDADPFRFPISSNSGGFLKNNLQPLYGSQPRSMIVRSNDPASWSPGSYYLFEPQAEDYNNGDIVNNKIFFNVPDKNLPGAARTTDVFRNNTHITWLFVEPSTETVVIQNFKLVATDTNNDPCDEGFMQTGQGAFLSFESNVGGTATLSLDLSGDGDFNDAQDRIIVQQVGPGDNLIYWDGKDGLGNTPPPAEDVNVEYLLTVRGGETHILLTDVENNSGGIKFTLFNAPTGVVNDLFYYDHSAINGPVSGSGAPGNPLPTNQPFTYQNNYGNNKILDYWAFFDYDGAGAGNLVFTIADDCTDVTTPPPTPNGPDNDHDGIADKVDIDDDNDGIPDKKEYCNPGNGFACLPGALDPSGDEDEDGVSNYLDANDPAFTNPCTDANNDGLCDRVAAIFDTDGDGVPDHLDLDSDNDGITDLVEAGHNQPDANRDGVIDGTPAAFGQNGLYNPIASQPNSANAVETYTRFDEDNDGVPDHDDLDSDNDGINDVAEAGYGFSDTNNDGRVDNGNGNPPIVGPTGLVPLIDPVFTGTGIPLPPDKDGDNIPDWHDLDSDNDLIHDVEEGGNPDADNDAIIGSGTPTVNANGQAFSSSNRPTSHPLDTDSDLVPDFHDLDSDNDGINDVREADGTDPNDDGLPGIGNIAVDARGIPTSDAAGTPLTSTSLPADTDNDLVRDYRDLDSDNDVINDVAETNKPDNDNDGRLGNGAPPVNADGQVISNMPTSFPTDTDNDGIPDFRELDSDDDGILDVAEANKEDPDFDGIVGTGLPNVDLNGLAIGFLHTSKPTDTDNDQIPDFQELDSDNDGILDIEECPDNEPCIDGDGDGTADFQDPDRDNDGIQDFYECETGFPCPDTDQDGIWDVDDLDTDGDMISDFDECPNGNPCPDSNGNTIPEWREFFCNPNIVTPQISNFTSTGNGLCEGSSITLSATNNVDVAGDSVTYRWMGPNGFDVTSTTVEQGPFELTLNNLSIADEGEYSLFLYTSEGCVGTPASFDLTINDSPETPTLQASSSQFCVDEMLELNSSIYSGGDVVYEWFFDNGNGMASLGTTTVPTYFINNLDANDSGVYSVQVSIGGCSSLMSNLQNVEVNNTFSQTPSLNVDEDALCSGEMIELNSSIVQGGNVQYEWWFDNGSGSVSLGTTNVPTFFIPNVDGSNAGVYNVTVNIGNCSSQLSNSQNVTVDEELNSVVPQLNVDEDLLCTGQTIQLNSTPYAGPNVQYHWLFNNGSGNVSVGTTTVPTLFIENSTAANSGFYSVMITSGNCSSLVSNEQNVEVNNDLSSIVPQLNVDEDVLCEGQTIELNSTSFSGSGLQYEWWFDNGNGNGPASLGVTESPTFFIQNASIANTGIYTVTVTMGLCITSPSNAQSVEITNDFFNQTPLLSVLDDQPCEGNTIELNSSVFNGGNVTYQWWFDNGNGPVSLGTTDLPTFFIENAGAANTGIYTVTANVGNCETQFSNAQDIAVTDGLADQTPQLSLNQSVLCEGEMLELNSTIVSGTDVVYEWFFNDGSGMVSLGTTNVPTFFLGNVAPANSGIYEVTASVGNCTSQPSNSQSVSITGDITDQTPALSINQSTLCEGEMLELNSSIISGSNVSYEWFFDDGNGAVSLGTTNIPTLFLDNLTGSNSGIYTVMANVGNCSTQLSNAQDVMVTNSLNMAPVLSLNDDILCEGEMLELNSTMVAGENVEYHWWFDDGSGATEISTTAIPTLFLDNTDFSNAGIYTVTASVGGCTSQSSNAQDVSVQAAPNLQATNTTDSLNIACPGDIIELGIADVPGATYEWRGPQGFTSNSVNPVLEDAREKNSGEYLVLIETDGCSFRSEATQVFVYSDLKAEDDVFQILFSDSLTTEDLMANDEFGNVEDWEIKIVSSPVNGNVEIRDNNQLVYMPNDKFSGSDNFIYEICNPDCPDLCAEALVKIKVNSNIEDDRCFVPNIITPNDDGANDFLTVPCLDNLYKNNNLKVFNRWGDKIYEAQPYENDWKGTYRGTPLPPGTYFYLLQLDMDSEECLQGYFTVTR